MYCNSRRNSLCTDCTDYATREVGGGSILCRLFQRFNTSLGLTQNCKTDCDDDVDD